MADQGAASGRRSGRIDWSVVGVFALLWLSAGFFWHARDWNTASRLMLTYALVDRGTVSIDGLHVQTGDRAMRDGHYYSDKAPGFALLACGPYVLGRALGWYPEHPTAPRVGLFYYWLADYWVTWIVSGLSTALAGAWLTSWAKRLGCRAGGASLIGLAYGLGTPAYVYATLGYGHQPASLAILASLALILHSHGDRRADGDGSGNALRASSTRPRLRGFVAGLAIAVAVVCDYPIGLLAIVLSGVVVTLALAGRWPWTAVLCFGLGALGPALVLAAYNTAAFGAPWQLSYFHLASPWKDTVHTEDNPIGLQPPDFSRLPELLWGLQRGLLVHAPIVILAVPGWIVLARRGHPVTAIATALSAGLIVTINLCYPEWTGGWSTGPRFLLTALPLMMVGVAGWLSLNRRWSFAIALSLALAGWSLMWLYQGADARIPDWVDRPIDGREPYTIHNPIGEVVWPLWNGAPKPGFLFTDRRFARSVTDLIAPEWVGGFRARDEWIKFVPLIVIQVGLAAALVTVPTFNRRRR